MKPIKITIEGNYLDCQLYRGWLYLWDFDGKLEVYDWNKLMDNLAGYENSGLPFTCAFKEGNKLYRHALDEFLLDDDFRNLLQTKFKNLEQIDFNITREELSEALIGALDTPTSRLPIDTEIYSSTLYFCTEKGLYRTNARKRERYPVSTKPKKLWDARALSIKASMYHQIAVSAGEDGLYELSGSRKRDYLLRSLPHNREVERDILQISDSHSNFANYINMSVYNSSLIGSSGMALFDWIVPNNSPKSGYRCFSKVIEASEIFGDDDEGLSWGVDGKVFRVTPDGFDIVSFNNYKENMRFVKQTKYRSNLNSGQVIGGASSYFGNIVEFENSLVVAQTDDEFITINEPVTRWRVYPRSMNYENQLHVLLEDRMEVYSFNHDYFVNQKEKKIGMEYKSEKFEYRKGH